MLYKIGEFSKVSMLSVKTLHYYHETGLLLPDSIDEETGYRYYGENEFEKAKLIKLLRSFEFTIKEIEEILVNYEDEDDIKSYLLEKNEQIQEKIRRYKKIQEKIIDYKPYKEVSELGNKEIIKGTVDNKLIASITYTGRYDECGGYIGKVFKAAGGSAVGKPFCIYHDEEFKEENAIIEVCLEVKKEINKKNVTCKTLKGGESISIIHHGPYETISDSYKYITDYIKSNSIEVTQPSRETYLKGPGMLLKGNPEKYLTEILFIIK